jgi:hypothetical protein
LSSENTEKTIAGSWCLLCNRLVKDFEGIRDLKAAYLKRRLTREDFEYVEALQRQQQRIVKLVIGMLEEALHAPPGKV